MRQINEKEYYHAEAALEQAAEALHKAFTIIYGKGSGQLTTGAAQQVKPNPGTAPDLSATKPTVVDGLQDALDDRDPEVQAEREQTAIDTAQAADAAMADSLPVLEVVSDGGGMYYAKVEDQVNGRTGSIEIDYEDYEIIQEELDELGTPSYPVNEYFLKNIEWQNISSNDMEDEETE